MLQLNIKPITLPVLMICCGLSFSAWASETGTESIFKAIDYSAVLDTRWAYGIANKSSQKLQFIYEPEFNVELSNNHKLTMIGRLRGDINDKLEPGNPSQNEISPISRRALIGDHADLALREFYYEATVGDTYLTLGKQQIVWGQADGLKLLDVVNPQDFREFILDDFSRSRIPLWTVNTEIPVHDAMLQLIWIPDQTYHALPETNSQYAFTSQLLVPNVPPGVNVNLHPIDKPNGFFADADYGARLSQFFGGWDITLNYLFHYNDNPVLFRHLTPGSQPTITITPRYERSHLIGGTFSNAFGDFVLRGEAGYSTGRYFLADTVNNHAGVNKSDELAYVFGLDWSGIENTFLSTQLFQSHVIHHQAGLVRDKVDTTLTFLARRDFLNDTLVAEVLLIHSTNNSDGLIRPKVSYEWQDNIKVWMGMDIFYGNQTGLFGQFSNNDRLVVGVVWGI